MAAAQRRRRQFNPRVDRLVNMPDNELLKRYRLNRDGIDFVMNLVSPDIQPQTRRSLALEASTKTLLTLRYLATGKFQLCNADDHGVSQPSVSRAVNDTVNSLCSNRITAQFIHFPTQLDAVRQEQRNFYRIARFPGVVGAIDCTHVQIQAPSTYENAFINRHQYHSINTQAVFDSNDRIIDLVARWPGSTHDSRILRQSGLQQLFEGNHVPGGAHLIGDSGYPSRRWLLTPFLRPQHGHQINYNRSHKRTRSCVERGFGQLKRRFHVLHGEIRQTPERACKVITACAVLHNICKARGIPLPDDEANDCQLGQARNQDREDDTPAVPDAVEGVQYREQFALNHFQ